MSISPPRGPKDERGSADTEAQPTPAEATAPASDAGPPAPIAQASGDAGEDRGGDASQEVTPAPSTHGYDLDLTGPAPIAPLVESESAARWRDDQIGLYESEAALCEVSEPKRSAWLLHEAARLREGKSESEREVVRLYTQSLSRDPSLQANTWALSRLFSAREAWDNVLRLLDAEARFAPLPLARDRADLLVEKGRILEDRLGRNEEALAAYRSAIEAAPGHPGGLLALLLLGVAEGNGEAVEEALAGLAAAVDAPGLKALFVIERARRRRGSLNGEGAEERIAAAAELLLGALAGPAAGLDGAYSAPILNELDRLSLLAGEAGAPGLRARVLDLFESRLLPKDGPLRGDPALLVAVHREKARLLAGRGSRDAALAVLARGLELLPRHPLLVADLLDLADEAGRPGAIAALADGEHLPEGEARDEALLRRAEAAGRAGAYGEAMGIMDRLPAKSPLRGVATLVRTRVLARTGDVEGLATAFAAEVEDLVERGSEASVREAAHLLVRAAVLRAELLREPAIAERMLHRALALVPHFPPAREALRRSLVDRGEVAALGALYEEEAAASTDEARQQALLRSAYLIHRDLARDAAATERLAAHAPVVDEITAQVAALCELGERAARGEEAPARVLPALRALAARLGQASDAPLASLELLGARWAELAGAGEARALAAPAAAALPGEEDAAALLERLERREGNPAAARAVVERELAALRAEDAAGERARALRFRLALSAAEVGQLAEALDVLAPLRRARDRAAVVWSLELARRAEVPALEAALLAEAEVAEVLVASPHPAAADGGRPLPQAGEVEEEGRALFHLARQSAARAAGVGDDDADAALFSTPALRAEHALGRLEAAARGGDRRTFVRRYGELAGALVGTELAVELRQDADLLALAAGVGGAPAAAGEVSPAYAAAAGFVAGGVGRQRARALEGLAELARHAGDSGAAAEVSARIGVRRLLAEPGRALPAAAGEDFLRALGPGPAPLVEIAVTDLCDGAAAPALDGLLRTRADRLAGRNGAGAAIAATLFADSAMRAEAEGRKVEAAEAYARWAALEPAALEPALGLGRLAVDKRARAAALLRAGGLLGDAPAAAERFGAAARLFEEEGLDDDAAAAYAEVLARLPGAELAYQSLHDLLAGRDDSAGLAALLAFKLAHSEDPAVRAALLAERAELHLAREPADTAAAIADLRRILALTPEHRPTLRTLARLASEAGRSALAADYLARALASGPDPDEERQLRLDLAAAHTANDDDAAAIAVLEQAAAARPDDRQVRELLVEAGMREQRWELCARELAALRDRADTPADAAAWTVRLGRLERDQRRDREAALAAFRTALRLDPLGESVRELASTLGDLPLPPSDAPLVTHAATALRAAIVKSPLAPRRLESLVTLCRIGGLADLGDVAAQLLSLLGGPAGPGRTRGLVRTLSPELLAPAPASHDVRRALELWPLLAPPLARLLPGDLAATGTGRATRVAPGREPRLGWVEAASGALGLGELVIHVVGGDDFTVLGFDAPDPTLVLGRGIAGGDAAVRFRVGRALALLAERATLLDRVPVEELRLAFAAALFLFTERLDPELDPGAIRTRAKGLGKVMARKERKALEPAMAELGPSALDVAGLRTHLLHAANRAGLLVSGDLATALKVVTGQARPSPADLEAREALDLVQFAFGDRFGALRDEARQRDRVNAGGMHAGEDEGRG